MDAILLKKMILYVSVFFAITFMVYAPFVYIYLKRRNDRAAAYKFAHPQAVKVYFKRPELIGWLTVICVNGEKPVPFSEGIDYGFYLLPGKNVIHLVYQWSYRDVISPLGYQTHTLPDKKLRVTIEADKEYTLDCNRESKEYKLEEK